MYAPIISAPEIESRIKTFIISFLQDLENLPTEELETYKAGLVIAFLLGLLLICLVLGNITLKRHLDCRWVGAVHLKSFL
jgi:hypothetical protein